MSKDGLHWCGEVSQTLDQNLKTTAWSGMIAQQVLESKLVSSFVVSAIACRCHKPFDGSERGLLLLVRLIRLMFERWSVDSQGSKGRSRIFHRFF